MPKVLVTDAGCRNTVSAVRSLGRNGIEVTGGEESRFPIALFSKYCKRRLVYPSPSKAPQEWLRFIMKELKNDQYDMILPIDDWTTLLTSKNKEILSRYTRVPVADYDIFMKAWNKAETLRLAIENDIPHPKTYSVDSLEILDKVSQEISLPVVIKPRESSGSRGIAYVTKREDLCVQYLGVHQRYEFPIVQEYIPQGGQAYGVSVLLNKDSEVRAVFAHRRLREFPLSGGPSTLRESIWKPELVELGIKLLQAMNWYGVAMVEFKEDPRDGIPKLMEVNPRFWGSLELARLAGVDFPYLLYKMTMEGDIESVTEYKVGVRCRWLLPGDILHFIANPNRFKMSPNFFNFFIDNTGYDILCWDDPGPTFGFFFALATDLFNLEKWKDVSERGKDRCILEK